jgi:thiol-disulfide isomerase/thioredoxin
LYSILTHILPVNWSDHPRVFATYSEKCKKIQLERVTYKITEKEMDSSPVIFETEFQGCIIGKTMGDNRMVGKTGAIYTPENLDGKVVLFNFWTVNCGPCIIEVPMLNRLATLYKENNDFILISVLLNDQDALDKLVEHGSIRGGIRYEVIPNSKTAVKQNFGYATQYPMPTNLFVDKTGKIYMRTVGGIQDQVGLDKIRSIIDNELTK